MVYWMVLSLINWMNGLMNDFFSYWMNEFALNFYLQVDALGLGNWEWCEGGGEGP